MKSRIHLLTLLLVSLLTLSAGAKKTPPNIVFIMADDMGYGDVAALNPESKIPTPNLDGLAADGMTFTDAHTPSAVCTPTRYGVVTGRYCWRGKLKRGVLNGYGEPLLEPGRETVASFLHKQGYHTGVVGKWHLGLGFGKTNNEFDFRKPVTDNPNTHGFDYSYIIPASLDFPPYVYIENGNITKFPSVIQPAQSFPAFLRKGPRGPDLIMENCLDDLTRQAADYIKRHAKKDKPFFLYFPLSAPHKPTLPHPRFRGQTELGPYGDFIAQVDWTVGQTVKAIDDAGIRDNTLVIYTSDNGSYMFRLDDNDSPDHVTNETVQAYRAERHRSNHIFRGTKADVWEGGHHVPFLVRWPGTVKPNSKAAPTICLTDLFATVAEITNAKLPRNAAEDSFSLLPLMKGKSFKRAPVVHHSASGMFAVRDGKWKLVLGNGSGGRAKPSGRPFETPYTLFDISRDVAEKTDLANKHPEIVSRLEKTLLKFLAAGRSR